MSTVQEHKRILLAEDCPDTQKILQLMLEQTGAEVILADNGKECLDRIFDGKSAPVDIVVMDIKMPLVDGLSALKQMREKGCDLPTVVLTASPSDDGEESAKELGCKAYLSKLKDRSSILPTIKKILAEGGTIRRQIALPVLPVYPDALPQDKESYKALLSYLSRVQEINAKFKEELASGSLAGLQECVVNLGAASFYGYYLLAKQLELLNEALASNDKALFIRYATTVGRTLSGMIAAKLKIEQHAN